MSTSRGGQKGQNIHTKINALALSIVFSLFISAGFAQELPPPVIGVPPEPPPLPLDPFDPSIPLPGVEPQPAAMGASAGGGEAAATGSAPDSAFPNASLNFQTDLFTGRFVYSVPIIVPPGRQGAQPQFALTYNSSGGNGWCGVGWGLDIGFIQRETRFGVPIKRSAPDFLDEYA